MRNIYCFYRRGLAEEGRVCYNNGKYDCCDSQRKVVMEFLIFSDSHGRREAVQEAFRRQIRLPDAVLFLGDGLRDLSAEDFLPSTLFTVRGNCDFYITEPAAPTEALLSFEGHKLLLCHGHTSFVKSGYGALISHAAELGADIVLFGHTHEAYEKMIPPETLIGGKPLEKPMYLFNPGSIAQGCFGTLVLKGERVLFSHGSLR